MMSAIFVDVSRNDFVNETITIIQTMLNILAKFCVNILIC